MKPDNIREELSQISKIVAGFQPEKKGYQVPENYFVQLGETLAAQAGIAKTMESHGKEVPVDYFEQNMEKLMKKRYSKVHFNQYWYKIAASIAFVIISVWFWQMRSEVVSDDSEIAWAYVQDHLYLYETDEFILQDMADEIEFDTPEETFLDSISEGDL